MSILARRTYAGLSDMTAFIHIRPLGGMGAIPTIKVLSALSKLKVSATFTLLKQSPSLNAADLKDKHGVN